eukprot:4849720-Pyramimonas_sp.AAC.1
MQSVPCEFAKSWAVGHGAIMRVWKRMGSGFRGPLGSWGLAGQHWQCGNGHVFCPNRVLDIAIFEVLSRRLRTS